MKLIYFQPASINRKWMRSIGLLLIILFSFLQGQSHYCIIAVIDGVRYSETFGDTSHQFIPEMWNKLVPQGTLYTSFFNNGWTKTNPGHSSILTGNWQYVANDGSERPNMPTIFEYYRKEKLDAAKNHWVILGKDKLEAISQSSHPEYGLNYSASVITSSSQYDDIYAFQNASYVLTEFHPKLAIINFPKTDNAGHTGIWNDYTSALMIADSLMLELWNLIQTDSIYQNRTTLIITNDHGRHSDGVSTGFKDHGDDCLGCRHIMMLILGPNIQGNLVDSTTYEQIDIAPTVGKILDFDLPYTLGKEIASVYTGMEQNDFEPIPKKIILIDNYPNPFNPVTTIRFNISSPTAGTLNILSSDGRRLHNLFKGYFSAGEQRIVWNAEEHASGMYIINLITNEGIFSKKCVLLK